MAISPSPGLNLIIGPNGSGKSSIVCAIALGLASSPSVLARTSKISGFIRHGADMAKIKILLTGTPNFWIQRRIETNNTSTWQLRPENGRWKTVSQADIIAKVTSLNIQLDNLCMFLPQERVKEFSSLKPKDLLSATEQAINKDAYEIHQKLLKDFQKQREITQKLSDMEGRKQRYQLQVDQLRGDVVRFKQVEDCRTDIENHEKTILWVKYQIERDIIHDLKVQYREAKENYKTLSSSLEPLRQELRQLQEESREAKAQFDSFQNNVNTSKRKIADLEKDYAKVSSTRMKTKQLLKNYDKELQEKQRQIATLEEALDKLKEHQIDLTSITEFQEQRKEMRQQAHDLHQQEIQLSQVKTVLNQKLNEKTEKLKDIKAKIMKAQDYKQKIVSYLRVRFGRDDIYQTWNWIKANKSKFISDVYGPICCEVTFSDPEVADYLQPCLEQQYWFSFLTTNDNDYRILNDYLNQQRFLKVSLLTSGRSNKKVRPPPPDLTRYGFTTWVSSLFEAPEAVMNLIKNLGSVDRVPIGKGNLAKRYHAQLEKDIFQKEEVYHYYIDSIQYIIRRSRYSSNLSVLSTQVHKSNIWTEHQGADKLNEIIEKKNKLDSKLVLIRNEIKEKSDQLKDIHGQISECTNKIQEISNKIKSITGMNDKIKSIEEKIESIRNDNFADPKKKEQLQEKLKKDLSQEATIIKKRFNALQSFVNTIKELSRLDNIVKMTSSKVVEKNEEIRENEKQYSEYNKRILELAEMLQTKQTTLKTMKNEAMEKCPLNDENRAMMEQLPGDLNILNDELSRLHVRLANLQHIDPSIGKKFAEAQKKLDETFQNMKELQIEEESKSKENKRIFDEWKSIIGDEIKKISLAFSELMETCGYRGEVRLSADNKELLESYKLDLLVAFNREGQMNILSSTRQSGGEKSVTTLMYILALQDCTQFPFRVVDEINQGMDEVNERNTFVQVMSYAMRKNQQSQYFLVTPKLLPQIDQMDGVTVLVVMNGPFVDKSLFRPITIDDEINTEQDLE